MTSPVKKVEVTPINDYIKRDEYREDMTRIETRVNNLAESQAMTSVAMQSMNNQMLETNKKIDKFSDEIKLELKTIGSNIESLTNNRSFQNGAIMMFIKIVGACGFLVTLDYIGIVKVLNKWINN